MKYNTLIIGSGIAGLSAALEAKKLNQNVLVISKTLPTHSQSVQAQGGINAVINPTNDSIETHIEDTLNASKNLASYDNIKYLCENAKNAIEFLDKSGVVFSRDENNQIAQRKFGGTKAIRTCYSSDYTGLKILHTLYDQCIKNDIKFLNEFILLDLIISNNNCLGGVFLDINTSTIYEIKSNNTVLATGGYAGIYFNKSTNSFSNTSDIFPIAYKNNIKLSNMEFVQFHPTALKNVNILISESARAEGGYIVDKDGNRFINELDSRDVISKKINEYIQKGEDVYLDVRHLGSKKIDELIPQEKNLAKEYLNIDISKELIPINPVAHYTMGGIHTDINCKTNIENLLACGECAQSDLHGANRLGGNSLLEAVVFGRKAGKNCTSNDSQESSISSKEKYEEYINNILNKEKLVDIYKIKNDLGSLMFSNVGIQRDKESLEKALDRLEEYKEQLAQSGIKDKSKVYNKNLIDLIEIRNMVDTSILLTQSAINRVESRGVHQRIDYPNSDEKYEKNSYILNDKYSFGESNED